MIKVLRLMWEVFMKREETQLVSVGNQWRRQHHWAWCITSAEARMATTIQQTCWFEVWGSLVTAQTSISQAWSSLRTETATSSFSSQGFLKWPQEGSQRSGSGSQGSQTRRVEKKMKTLVWRIGGRYWRKLEELRIWQGLEKWANGSNPFYRWCLKDHEQS